MKKIYLSFMAISIFMLVSCGNSSTKGDDSFTDGDTAIAEAPAGEPVEIADSLLEPAFDTAAISAADTANVDKNAEAASSKKGKN